MRKTHILYISTLVVLLIGYIYTQPHMSSHTLEEAPFHQRDATHLPPAKIIAAATLNYNSFAASLTWIAGLLYFGDWRLSHAQQPPQYLETYAETVFQLDSEFIHIFDWLNSTYIGSHLLENRSISFDDLETLRRFNEQGIQKHPNYWKPHYLTGMNYIGYSSDRTPEERLKELDYGIKYLQQCSMFSQCPNTIPANVSFFYQRKQQLRDFLNGKSPSNSSTNEELQFYKTLYPQTMDDQLRKQLEQSMLNLGMSKQEIKDLDRGQIDQMRQHFESTHSYLPLDLWTQVVYPTGSSQELLLKSTQE